jgi:cytidine kinase
MTPDLVIAGNLLIDDVVFADGRTSMGEPGGAALYTALGASLWGVRVGVLSVAGGDYPRPALEALGARGADLAGVRRVDSPALRTWLLYERAGRQVVHQLGGATHVEVSPAPGDLPEAWRTSRIVHLAPMPFGVQAEWTRHLADRGSFTSLDPYEIVREENLSAWREVLSRVDALFVSEDDLALEGHAQDSQCVLERLATDRTRWIVFKRGARGGCIVERGLGAPVEWKALGDRIVDATGAGDAFAGGFLAGLARGESRDVSIERGVVAASFAIEAWGAAGLLAANPERAEERRQAWFGARSRG